MAVVRATGFAMRVTGFVMRVTGFVVGMAGLVAGMRPVLRTQFEIGILRLRQVASMHVLTPVVVVVVVVLVKISVGISCHGGRAEELRILGGAAFGVKL